MDAPSSPLTAADAAARLGARLEGDGARVLRRVSDLATAGPDAAAFVAPGRAVPPGCAAGMLLLAEGHEAAGHPCVARVAHPALAAARLAQWLHPRRPPAPGVHSTAVVAPGARLGVEVAVGPGCVIEDGAEIGDGSVLLARVTLGAGARVGAGCWLHPGVVLYAGVTLGRACTVHANAVIGADGFGYVWDGREHVKVPQLGTVVVGDGVEIGAGTCIDRATFGATRIGDGCILDNLVQIGHNCELGRFVVMCGQAALAGSTKVGDGAVMGGRAAAAGHLTIGAGAQIAGGAGVTADVPAGAKVGGLPAWDLRLEQRARAVLRRLARGEDGASGGE